LIEDQIRRFLNFEKRYPAEILLSPLRFLAKGGSVTHYRIPQFSIAIPILFDRKTYEAGQFEVLVRGSI
jgi:hypothetical protein